MKPWQRFCWLLLRQSRGSEDETYSTSTTTRHRWRSCMFSFATRSGTLFRDLVAVLNKKVWRWK